MKASELRIGNYIFLTKDVNKSYVITKTSGAIIDYIECESVLSKPILLTEEWLLKFGFEKGSLIYKNDSFNLNGEIVFKGENSFRYFGLETKIKYVHQLQNLYFALTGYELTIKEL